MKRKVKYVGFSEPRRDYLVVAFFVILSFILAVILLVLLWWAYPYIVFWVLGLLFVASVTFTIYELKFKHSYDSGDPERIAIGALISFVLIIAIIFFLQL